MNLRGSEFEFLPPPDLVDLIDARLRGRDTWLPPLTRDDDPADIFVDLAELSEEWRQGLQSASAKLLAARVNEFRPSDAEAVSSLGELCYLVARIGSREGLGPLRTLASDSRATGTVAPGEDLRLRALRAMVGLLAAESNLDKTAYRGALMEALAEPRLAMASLIGLVGLWPEETDTFLGMLPANVQNGDLLDLAVELTFRRNSQTA